jgi:protease IV
VQNPDMASFFKTFFAVLLAIFTLITLSIMIIVMVASPSSDEHTEVEDYSILHLTLEHEIIDRHYENRFHLDMSTFQPIKKDGLNFILNQIHKAKLDPKVTGIFLDLKSPMAGLATMQEIRDALVDFKSSGKWIVAYSDFYSQGAYYLASSADEIYMEPEGLLEFKGLRSDVTFMKGLLKKIGVDVQVIKPKNNKFKSAVEPFMLDSMSEANEEQLNKILNSIWGHIAQDVAASRNMTLDQVNTAVNELASRTSQTALDAHLIDGIKYRDELVELLKSKSGTEEDEPVLVSLNDYSSSAVKDFIDLEKVFAKDKIAVIYGLGSIDMGEGDEESIGSDGLAKQISEARKDSSIKAIVLRVNSPGGSALASDVIWREMTLAKKTKPVIVSMGDVAASGGYYISCNADMIFASEMTITGSIGVFGMIPNTAGLEEGFLGLKHDGVKTHQYADIMDIHRPLRSSEMEIWQGMVDHIYDDFTGKVASGRSMEQSSVDSIGQGRIWSGVDALGNRLIDAHGGLDEAIAEAAKRAGLTEYRVKNLPEEVDPLQQIIKDLTGQAKANPLEMLSREDAKLFRMVKQYQEVMEMKGVQMRMPFLLDIR